MASNMTGTKLYRFAVVTVLIWGLFITCATVFGATTSFYTGKAEELPKWNGWSYLFFSAREFAVMGVILTWPIAMTIGLIVSALSGGRMGDQDARVRIPANDEKRLWITVPAAMRSRQMR